MLALLNAALAFAIPAYSAQALTRTQAPCMQAGRDPFNLQIDLPPRGKCNLKFKPTFEASEVVVVRYGMPFGLNVENKGGRAVCTKDGSGGEKVGDVLRYCTEFTMALSGGEASVSATVGMFSGAGLGWKLGLCDVDKAGSWDAVRFPHDQRSSSNCILTVSPTRTDAALFVCLACTRRSSRRSRPTRQRGPTRSC